MEIKFISYSGEYPNLCRGELVLEIDGKEERFGVDYNKPEYKHMSWTELDAATRDINPAFWTTGGCIRSTSDYSDMWAEHGPWGLDADALPEHLRGHGEELIRVFNENVPWGCCGGCI